MARLTGAQMETLTRKLIRDVDNGSGVTAYVSQDYLDFHNLVYHSYMALYQVDVYQQLFSITFNPDEPIESFSPGPLFEINRIVRAYCSFNGGSPFIIERKSVEEVTRKQKEYSPTEQPIMYAIEQNSGDYLTYSAYLWPVSPAAVCALNIDVMVQQTDITAATMPQVGSAECRWLCMLAARMMGPPIGRTPEYLSSVTSELPKWLTAALNRKQNFLDPTSEQYTKLG